MTAPVHAGLSAGRWTELSLLEQLANIGSEVGRASRAKSSGKEERLAAALERAVELFDLTLADSRWRGRRGEIARAREVVCDFLVGANQYGSTAESLDAYFVPFAAAAGRRRDVELRTAGQSQADADRAGVARFVQMSDREREAYYLASNRNMLRMFDDAREADNDPNEGFARDAPPVIPE